MSILGIGPHLFAILLAGLFVSVVGCRDDDDPGGTDAVTDTDTNTVTEESAHIVLSGVARRSAELALGGDGVGTLCAEVITECPTPDFLSTSALVSGLSVPDADLAETTDSVSFRFEIEPAELPNGFYQLFGFLREDGGTCEGGPISGDPISVMLLGGAACPTLEITGPGKIDGLELYLNATAP
jgi:hypothetical protein